MIKKIVLLTFPGYGGGMIAIAALCKTLNEIGYDCKIIVAPCSNKGIRDTKRYRRLLRTFTIKTLLKTFISKHLDYSFLGKKLGWKKPSAIMIPNVKVLYNLDFNKNDTLIVYPEVIFGNPLYGKNVARWLLFRYTFKGIEGAYDNNDIFFAYREAFNDDTLNPKGYIVKTRYFDTNLYHQSNYGERYEKCYLLHKGKNRNDIPKTFDAPLLDGIPYINLAHEFNKYKKCYIYDTQTAYATLAALCGCIPIIIMEPGKTESDYRKRDDPPHYGIAWGDTKEQIQYAIDTKSQLLKSMDFEKSNLSNALKFIEIMENHFGHIKKNRAQHIHNIEN